jgi:hypothetical protein
MQEYLECWDAREGIDLFIGRWIADYDDPDNFTFGLMHSGTGLLRTYFSSPRRTGSSRRRAARLGH